MGDLAWPCQSSDGRGDRRSSTTARTGDLCGFHPRTRRAIGCSTEWNHGPPTAVFLRQRFNGGGSGDQNRLPMVGEPRPATPSNRCLRRGISRGHLRGHGRWRAQFVQCSFRRQIISRRPSPLAQHLVERRRHRHQRSSGTSNPRRHPPNPNGGGDPRASAPRGRGNDHGASGISSGG